MKRSEFGSILLGMVGLSVLAGCKSRIGKSARDASLGDPYRCNRCGHLLRSKTDITGKHCPRCYAKQLVRISEEEMREHLSQGEQ